MILMTRELNKFAVMLGIEGLPGIGDKLDYVVVGAVGRSAYWIDLE